MMDADLVEACTVTGLLTPVLLLQVTQVRRGAFPGSVAVGVLRRNVTFKAL
jgi:hypothetical protein